MRCRHCGRVTRASPAFAIGLTLSASGRVVPRTAKLCPCRHARTGPPLRTRREWQDVIDGRHGHGVYTIARDYVPTARAQARVRHRCGRVFDVSLHALVRGAGDKSAKSCPCLHTRRVVVTRDAHVQELRRAHGSAYTLKMWRGNAARTHTYGHTCGHVFDRDMYRMIATAYCPRCHGPDGHLKNRTTVRELQADVDRYNAPGEYVVTALRRLEPRGFRYRVRHVCGSYFEGSTELRRESHLGRCPACYGTNRQAFELRVGGRLFRGLRGYEGFALRSMVASGYDPWDITVRGDARYPVVWYNKERGIASTAPYYPDFYIESEHRIVEVKSPGTCGLVNDKNYLFRDYWPNLQAKARACLRQGYRFTLVLYVRNGKHGVRSVRIPRDWLYIDKHEMARRVGVTIR